MTQPSPLRPATMPTLPPIKGVRLATARTGMKYQGRDDLLLVELAEGSRIAGVLTRSKTASAPVDWCRQHLPQGTARAILVNAGNANAFTGHQGLEGVTAYVAELAQQLGVLPEQIFVASTGVIGEPLSHEKITRHYEGLMQGLHNDHWQAAAGAIMTTDTFPKYATRTVMLDGVDVTVNGIAKGSGMIAPDMATMLGFVMTDAALPASLLQALLRETKQHSFNAITVDGDMSTSDTVLMAATGACDAGSDIVAIDDQRLAAFRQALQELMLELALLIVRDGEGATKLVTVRVEEAESERAARSIAMSIANSPLVKTAIAGEDANWGRIVMAVGKAGEAADRDKLWIRFGDRLVAEHGLRAPGYDESEMSVYMKRQEIDIAVGVGVGDASYTAYTCDLTHGYISINADYRS